MCKPTITLCKVCGAFVPRRKDYQPTCCEACQKIFRRHFYRRNELVCTGGRHQCIINRATRRSCLRCRVEKCIAAGMMCYSGFVQRTKAIAPKLPRRDSVAPTDDSSSNHSSGSGANNYKALTPVVPLTQNLDLPDEKGIEDSLRSVIEAYTELHPYEFMPLKRIKDPFDENDSGLVSQMAHRHIHRSILVSVSYCKYLKETIGFEESELKVLMVKFVQLSEILYNALPRNPNTTFLGYDPRLKTEFARHFPDLNQVVKTHSRLVDHLEEWNPTFIETCILFGLLFFNENALKVPKMAKLRQQLYIALNIHLSRKIGNNPEAIESRQKALERSLQLAGATFVRLHRWLFLTANRETSFAPLASMTLAPPITV